MSGISLTDPDNEELELGKEGASGSPSLNLAFRTAEDNFWSLVPLRQEREYHNSGTHKLRLRRLGEAMFFGLVGLDVNGKP